MPMICIPPNPMPKSHTIIAMNHTWSWEKSFQMTLSIIFIDDNKQWTPTVSKPGCKPYLEAVFLVRRIDFGMLQCSQGSCPHIPSQDGLYAVMYPKFLNNYQHYLAYSHFYILVFEIIMFMIMNLSNLTEVLEEQVRSCKNGSCTQWSGFLQQVPGFPKLLMPAMVVILAAQNGVQGYVSKISTYPIPLASLETFWRLQQL